jgi:hypothetical protein
VRASFAIFYGAKIGHLIPEAARSKAGFAAARLLGLRFRILSGARISVFLRFVARKGSPLLADHSSKGVLPSVAPVCDREASTVRKEPLTQ